jgi:hypothetical protein
MLLHLGTVKIHMILHDICLRDHDVLSRVIQEYRRVSDDDDTPEYAFNIRPSQRETDDEQNVSPKRPRTSQISCYTARSSPERPSASPIPRYTAHSPIIRHSQATTVDLDPVLVRSPTHEVVIDNNNIRPSQRETDDKQNVSPKRPRTCQISCYTAHSSPERPSASPIPRYTEHSPIISHSQATTVDLESHSIA